MKNDLPLRSVGTLSKGQLQHLVPPHDAGADRPASPGFQSVRYKESNAASIVHRCTIPGKSTTIDSLYFNSRFSMVRVLSLADASEVPEGQGRAFPAGEQMIAVFREESQLFAIDDFCPHQGASLACGWLEEGAVACPWHAWRFSIRTGQWLDNPRLQVATYKVWEEAGKIWVELPDPPSSEKDEQALPPPCSGSEGS
jgi:nitrite reductase (NADH) small subunit/3-phenylpropionate/trans-cinnamate dioxygenase ferredoxin subunit